MPNQPNYVAIDIAKDSLQIQTDQVAWSVPHTAAGHRQLLARLQGLIAVQVVCEASGGYEQPLLAVLYQHQIPVSLLNPARVRAFARSEGQQAKTDPLDAALLLRFAREKRPAPTPPPAPAQAALAAWLDRRAQLSEQLAREKNRLQKKPGAGAAQPARDDRLHRRPARRRRSSTPLPGPGRCHFERASAGTAIGHGDRAGDHVEPVSLSQRDCRP